MTDKPTYAELEEALSEMTSLYLRTLFKLYRSREAVRHYAGFR